MTSPVDAQWLAMAADALDLRLFVLDPGGALVHANAAGRRLLSGGATLRLVADDRVLPVRPAAEAMFATQFRRAASGERVLLDLQHFGFIGSLTPLGERPGVQRGCVLLALASETGHEMVPMYAAELGLSPAETRVLTRLVRGDSTADAARALGLTVATVRSHLASIRNKTGHGSVRDLLYEIASLPPLARHDAGLRPPMALGGHGE